MWYNLKGHDSHVWGILEKREGKWLEVQGQIRIPNLVLGHVVKRMEGKKASEQNTKHMGGHCPGKSQIATSNKEKGKFFRILS